LKRICYVFIYTLTQIKFWSKIIKLNKQFDFIKKSNIQLTILKRIINNFVEKRMNFSKYQGAGNDFIIVDQRENQYIKIADTELINKLCDRRFGIGADGLMLLQNHPNYDFEMIYFNSDGNESSMCGNGGRCIAAFAKKLNIIQNSGKFIAIDGEHDVIINEFGDFVELKMKNVDNIEIINNSYVLNTGSPHYVQFVDQLKLINVYEEGRKIRYSDKFNKEGININFVESIYNELHIGTYERGVEAETLACGTGVTAAAIAYQELTNKAIPKINIKAKGGDMLVKSEKLGNTYSNIWLCGPAKFVFNGVVNLSSF